MDEETEDTIFISKSQWPWEALGFESEQEFTLWRYFNKLGNPFLSGYEVTDGDKW